MLEPLFCFVAPEADGLKRADKMTKARIGLIICDYVSVICVLVKCAQFRLMTDGDKGKGVLDESVLRDVACRRYEVWKGDRKSI